MRSLSILVVDDRKGICESLAKLLSGEGHRVCTAVGVAPALEVLRKAAVDLVITDMLLSGDSGESLISQVVGSWPAIRILAISGGDTSVSGASCLERAQKAGAHALLLKPFARDQLNRVIRHVIGADD
jgi:DNA-binding NtrC family response regulator